MFHDTYTVCSCTKSASEWTYRSKTHYESAGGVMLMEPGEIHVTTRIAGPADFRVLFIDPSVMIGAAEELGLSPAEVHFRFAQLYDRGLFEALAGLHASLERPSTELERQSRFADCLRLLLETSERSPAALNGRADCGAVRKAREFLDAHVAVPIGLEELAAVAGGADRFHLIHTFTAQVGLPPHAYQIRLRIARARRLLAGGTPPADVAAALGFADQSHFTRHFHHVLGTTPAAYAKAIA